ncbi:MAG: leucyl aminopeptidase [Holosporales bacterium]|jgi:leucyl aminopeptidase|nr:leucyl aminopeptidase [Holosporales bacterium]
MMNIGFSELVDLESKNVLVIVANDTGSNFVKTKLKSILKLDEVALENILEGCFDLSYAKIRNFNVILNGKIREILIVGAGKKDLSSRASIEKLGGYIFSNIKSENANLCISNCLELTGLELTAAYLASGILLKNWTFDKHKTSKTSPKVLSVECETNCVNSNKNIFGHMEAIQEGVFLTRELVSEPANIMDPDRLLEEAKNLKALGVKVDFLSKRDMEKIGMNAFLGVAKGSDNPAYLVTMEYKSDKTKDAIALVGKGLTFDSGGLCLKPSKGMADMKGDMAGAAVVIGVLKSLALQKANVNVVGVIGIVENMISGKAQKPGDIVVAMSGKTIEVDNTDAEGRLVLADALWYTKEKYNPKIVIDFATLTGAIQVALGHEFAGIFSNSDKLFQELEKAGNCVGEKLWRLPLHPSYEEDIKSEVADIRNVGSGRGAGSITAALFLKHFIDPNVEWAHIDIAATEWDTKARALSQKGATGFGVRLLDEFVAQHCLSC